MSTFRYLTAIYTLQRFSAIKNDHLQNTTTDVLKPHQAEVFRIATALQALHSAAPARIWHIVQCVRRSDVHTWCVPHTSYRYTTGRLARQRTQYFTAERCSLWNHSSSPPAMCSHDGDMVLHSTIRLIAHVQPAVRTQRSSSVQTNRT